MKSIAFVRNLIRDKLAKKEIDIDVAQVCFYLLAEIEINRKSIIVKGSE